MSRFWQSLEEVAGACAVPAEWQRWMAGEFAAFRTAFLQPMTISAGSHPCLRECGCSHRVIRQADGRIIAVCDCESWDCDDIPLQPEDVVIWQLDLRRLGRAIVRALEIDRREQKFSLPWTLQVGAWSAASLPVVLTICADAEAFRRVVAELTARMGEGFLLFAPTSRFLDVASRELLAHARAGFFTIDSNFTLLPSGLLHARKRAGELFAQFTDEPEVVVEETARQAFAIVKALDSQKPQREASLLTVFRLYCVEGLSAEATAQRCGCSKATVLNRLNQIHQRTGMNPANLRVYSAQFQVIEDSLRDPRARRIRLQDALDTPEDDEETPPF